MKTVKYEDCMKVVCPVCEKIILNDTEDAGDTIHPCKHLHLWHNSVGDNICFASRSFKPSLDSDYKEFRKIVREHKMTVLRYRGNYIGGCQYPVDTVAFKK